MNELLSMVSDPPEWVWWPEDPLETWDRPVELLTPDELLSQMEFAERQVAVTQARQLRLLARYQEVRERAGKLAGRSAPEEVAVALRYAPARAANELHAAMDLIARLPDTVGALESGKIDLPRARAIADVTRVLDVDKARAVEAKVLPKAVDGYVLQQVRSSTRYYVLKADPHGATKRRERTVQDRRASFQPLDDGGGEVAIVGSGERTYLAWSVCDTLARRQRAAGDERTLDQLRHDIALARLIGTDTQPVQVTAYLHVPATTIAGVSDDPGILDGYGPLTAQACRELAARDALWRRVFTDPIKGTVRDVDRQTYQPPAALRELVEVRDGTCRFPGCTRPAHRCEIDHTKDWAKGGTTSETNLGASCKPHHRLKHLCGWTLEQSEPGTFTWRSPVGQQAEKTAEPTLDLTEDIPPF